MQQSVNARNFVNSSNLTLWIKALISGDYLQHSPYYGLYDPEANSYTATGLAAKLFGGKYIQEFKLCDEWFYRTFGLPVKVERIDSLNEKLWSFADIAAYLVSFLPSNEAKYRLQTEIVRAVSRQRSRQEDEENVTLASSEGAS